MYLWQVGTVYQLVITISILASQVLGIQSVLGTPQTWPLLLALTVVPAIFQLVTLPLCPESPKYILIAQGKEVEAQKGSFHQFTLTISNLFERLKIRDSFFPLLSLFSVTQP
jgi:SP family facilitated glucose transporter-like MFS transporter 1